MSHHDNYASFTACQNTKIDTETEGYQANDAVDDSEGAAMASHWGKADMSGQGASESGVNDITESFTLLTPHDEQTNMDRGSLSSGRSEGSHGSKHSGSEARPSNGLCGNDNVNGYDVTDDVSASDSDNDGMFESAATLDRPSPHVTEEKSEGAVDTSVEPHATHRNIDKSSKKKNPFKFLRRLTSKGDVKHKETVPVESSEVNNLDRSLMDVKVDSLPQVFVTKYMGYKPCHGLWGIKHTRAPVEELIQDVTGMDPEEGQDLPLVQLRVSRNGIHVREHSANACKTKKIEKELIPIEFISYGVQDVKYTRVFSFILVREMSSRSRKLECHAYVCDSTVNCRRLSLSVAFAFQEYSKNLEGKPYKFQVDLKDNGDQSEVGESTAHGGEDFEA